jgi:hypothetical protein
VAGSLGVVGGPVCGRRTPFELAQAGLELAEAGAHLLLPNRIADQYEEITTSVDHASARLV